MKRFFVFLLSVIAPVISSAHVAYVAPEGSFYKYGGMDFSYFLPIFNNPIYVALLIATPLLIIAIVFLMLRTKVIKNFFDNMQKVLSSYHEFIPWIVRLGLGILLIGSGTSQFLLTPIIHNVPVFGFLQILLGFFFLIGFLLVPASIVTMGLYVISLFYTPYMIGNLDVFALAFGVLIFHSPRPGLDDMLQISLLRFFKISRHYLAPIMRAGVGIAMIYLAVYEKFLNPHVTDMVVQMYHLDKVIPVSPAMWVLSVGTTEVVIGLFILIGFFTRLSSCIAIVVLSFSFFFFKESVASHVSLFSILAIVAIEGGGIFSIDRIFEKKNKVEVVSTGVN